MLLLLHALPWEKQVRYNPTSYPEPLYPAFRARGPGSCPPPVLRRSPEWAPLTSSMHLPPKSPPSSTSVGRDVTSTASERQPIRCASVLSGRSHGYYSDVSDDITLGTRLNVIISRPNPYWRFSACVFSSSRRQNGGSCVRLQSNINASSREKVG